MTLIIPLAIADEAPSPSLSQTCVFHHSALCLTDSLALSPASELFSTTTLSDISCCDEPGFSLHFPLVTADFPCCTSCQPTFCAVKRFWPRRRYRPAVTRHHHISKLQHHLGWWCLGFIFQLRSSFDTLPVSKNSFKIFTISSQSFVS